MLITTGTCLVYPLDRLKSNNTDNTKDWWDCRGTGTFSCWWRCQIMWTLWRTFGSFLWSIVSREMKTHVPRLSLRVIIALFIMAQTQEHPTYPSTGEWINNWWYIHTMKYYSMKRKNVDNIQQHEWISKMLLDQRSQTQKNSTNIHYLKFENRQIHLCR